MRRKGCRWGSSRFISALKSSPASPGLARSNRVPALAWTYSKHGDGSGGETLPACLPACHADDMQGREGYPMDIQCLPYCSTAKHIFLAGAVTAALPEARSQPESDRAYRD